MKTNNKNIFLKQPCKILFALFTVFLLLTQNFLPIYSQTKSCTKTKIQPMIQNPVQIPIVKGNANNDPTFNNIEQFADLDLPSLGDSNVISICVQKSDSGRILNINPTDGSLTLSNSIASTDPVSSNDPASIRGICTFNSLGNQLFLLGNGPKEFGFDRIYPFNINFSIPSTFTRTKNPDQNNINDYFIPSDLATSVAVTPNERFLVYLQADTLNNNQASLQSVEIKSNKTLSKSFIGQELAKVLNAGNYLEFAKSPTAQNSRFAFGVFSNLIQGKNGSGTSFAVFKINQENAVNTILAEFKKDNENFPLPGLFNKLTFVGFSGFKLFQRGSDLFLFISYYENDPNAGFSNFSYITKLVLFKLEIRSDLAKTAHIKQIGEPITTVFKTSPCTNKDFHGISGPVWVSSNNVYIADNNTNQNISKNENYFASYFIDWDKALLENATEAIFRLSSVPVRTSTNLGERNTDLVVTQNNKFAYLVTSSTQESALAKIYGYSLEHLDFNCFTLAENLTKNGVCDSANFPPFLVNPIPAKSVFVNETVTFNLDEFFKDEDKITYSITNNQASEFLALNNNIITISPLDENLVGEYSNITINAIDILGQKTPATFSVSVNSKIAQLPTSPTPKASPSTAIASTEGVKPPQPPSAEAPPQTTTPITISGPTINLPPSKDTGRPAQPPRPPRPPLFGGPPPKLPKPPKSPKEPKEVKEPKPEETKKPELPKIEIVQEENIELIPNITKEINIDSLNLKGRDQVIISPNIPHIILASAPLEVADIEVITPDSLQTPSPSPSATIKPTSPSTSPINKINITCENAHVICDGDISCTKEGYAPTCVNNTPDCCRNTGIALDCDSSFLECKTKPKSPPSPSTIPYIAPAPECIKGKSTCKEGFTVYCPRGTPPCCIENEVGCSVFDQGILVGCNGGEAICKPSTSVIIPPAISPPIVAPQITPTVPLPSVPLSTITQVTNLKPQECCTCQNGKLNCKDNLSLGCEGGKVQCLRGAIGQIGGPSEFVLACCRGNPPLEVCNGDDPTIKCLNTVTSKGRTKEQLQQEDSSSPPTLTKETRAAIKAGFGGHLINLKEGVKLKAKDLSNLIFIVVEEKGKKSITQLTGKAFLTNKNFLLAKLNFPNTIKSQVVTLVTLLNKGAGNKEVIAKGSIKLFESLDFKNISPKTNKETLINGLPEVTKIEGKITHKTVQGEKIIRLSISGKNFASRLIKINDQLFITEPYKTHTAISFSNESNIEILRVRVLNKGRNMLVTLRSTGGDITKIPFTISTPKGQLFVKELGIKLPTSSQSRSIKLELDNLLTVNFF